MFFAILFGSKEIDEEPYIWDGISLLYDAYDSTQSSIIREIFEI